MCARHGSAVSSVLISKRVSLDTVLSWAGLPVGWAEAGRLLARRHKSVLPFMLFHPHRLLGDELTVVVGANGVGMAVMGDDVVVRPCSFGV